MSNQPSQSTDVRDLFPSKYLSGYDLKGKTPTLKIARIVSEDVRNPDGEIKTVTILYFDGAKKGLRLIKTVAKIITGAYGFDMGQWIGKPLTLYLDRVKAFGAVHDVCRVRIPES